MRKISIFISFFLLASILALPLSNAATAKAGGVCTKAGTKAVVAGVKFTCVKSGKKLIWKKNAVIPTPTQTATPTATATATPTPTLAPFVAKIPIALPVPQTGEITFANAVSKFSSIPQVAWQRVQDAIATNQAVDIPTTLSIGPTTSTTKEQILTLLQKEYRLFQGFSQPSSYIGLVYNGNDEPWAETQLGILLADLKSPGLVSHFVDVMRQACDLSNAANPSCSGGNSLNLFPSTGGGSLYGVQEPYWSAAKQNVGPMSQVNHEYTHNVQFAQWNGAPFKSGARSGTEEAHTKMPCWFQEGQANGIGITVWAPDLQSYINARKGNVARGINPNLPKPSLSTFSAESFTKFLYQQNPMTCYSPSSGDYQLGYSVGYAASEALIAIGGPLATMALLTKMADGDDWSSAFQHVYGITWEQGSSVLGQVLAAEYAVLPLGSNG